MSPTNPIELLAPAGNWDCARAAIENGADAIYFGLEVGFNARARAANFHIDELSHLIDLLHRQAVRGYVTLNTLVFTDELPRLEEHVRQLAEAGVDAVLVQDLGVARLVKEICPEMVLHASTQMTLTNATAIEVVRELGIERAVLARELSLKEIRQIAESTSMPLEVFVHGALCVAYSGQCLTSESFGGRSANRGQCAQACRLPYELFCDGQPRDLGNVKYLLSPQDLAAHDLVPQLIDAGVCSLKIEGRLKTPEYVANVCQHYRLAIDEVLSGRSRQLSDADRHDLELSFSRGFSPGWLEGCDHKRLVPGLSSSKRGVEIGQVQGCDQDRLHVQLTAPLAVGDGIVLEGDRFGGQEVGGRVYLLRQAGRDVSRAENGLVSIALQRGLLTEQSIARESRVWKTDDPRLTRRLRKSYGGADPKKRVAVDVHVTAKVGQPLRLRLETADMQPQELISQHVAEAARKHPLTVEVLTEQFSRLGGSVYRLGRLTATLEGNPMVPLSVLGKLRQAMLQSLDESRCTLPRPCAPSSCVPRMLARVGARVKPAPPVSNSAPEQQADAGSPAIPVVLRVLCRSLTQLEAALASEAKHVIADFHDLRQYAQAVALTRASGAEISLATLRIHKPGEGGLFRALAKHQADRWLVRNLAAVDYCRRHGIAFDCDFSLNVTNPLTAEQLKRWGADRITAAYDLNRDQLFELARCMPSDWLEVVVHQHMPMFHMEHCVFCSVLSPGKNKSDCGRPCDRHEVELRDRVGANHVLHADIGCRNTLYNGTAQSGAEAVASLIEMGVRSFRIELLKDANPAEVRKLIGLYRALIAGRLSGTQVWQQLKAHNRVGVTRGTLEQPRDPLAIL